ncbi:hypothetical protein N7509_011832 [Penicillium cosmopolitanum]|uniref:DUF300 domain protein n=1 Tax=Penicillium cosmopolitanum TaxID=1131564 RepID=A0A9W9VE18_9EURO|nr:uncharacterized protein N7509_011832 [Penicillium cosmopolitanum]KAJ5378713.1 hypothetical protein N7509_011832 [Penicillium cosmopolitanum]
MGWTTCNTTTEEQKIEEVDLWDGGITFHELSLILGGVCALIACVISIFLIMGHATHYSKPVEQRHIIRILWMVPVYSVVAWISILFYHDAVYFEVIGNCYEAFCIAAFFGLMCHYIAPDLHSQKDYFRGIQPKTWLWPLNHFQKWKWCGGERLWRNPRSGLTWFNIIWTGVFQYCVLRVLMTVVSVLAQVGGRYCEESMSPAFAHVWVIVFESISVSIAMYCLIQFYYQIKDDISEHKPFMKILSIKLVIFLSFWQSTLISILVTMGAINSTPQIALADLKYGLPELLINIEMAIFSFLHLWAFAWKPYAVQPGEVTDFYGNGKESYQGGRFGVKALVDAMNPFDLVKAIGRGGRWLFVGRKNRTQDSSYQQRDENNIGLEASQSGTAGTSYQGAGTAMSGARKNRYGGDEEGQVLLANAQSNPETGHFGTSPYSESDEYLSEQPARFYQNSSGRESHGHALQSDPSPYDDIEQQNLGYTHDGPNHPYPVDGPLREQAPMPMPDPYQPPPPYPDDHDHRHPGHS